MGLDRLQCASRIVSFVIGKAQAANWALLREEAYNYEKVKVAILDCLELTSEHYHRMF